MRTILAALVQRHEVAVLAVDGKSGLELGLLGPRAAVLVTDQSSTVDLLRDLEAELLERGAKLRALGLTDWTSDLGPRIVVAVDELAVLTDAGTRGDEIVRTGLRRLAATGRALGLALVAATQRPSAESIGTGLRDLIPVRIAHPVARRTDATMILGELPDGPSAEVLPLEPGRCLVRLDAERIIRSGRTRYTSPDLLRSIAAESSAPAWKLSPAISAEGRTSAPAERTDRSPAILEALRDGPSTIPALSRRLNRPDREIRLELRTLADLGLVDRLDGSRWSAAGPPPESATTAVRRLSTADRPPPDRHPTRTRP